MRGDLHTLKRVCEYASKVMLVAEYVLAALVIATVAVLIASFSYGPAEDFLRDWISSGSFDETYRRVAACLKFTAIWIMGFITVKGLHDIMCDIRDEHSPFTERNTKRMISISLFYLASAFVLLILDIIAGTPIAFTVFVFLGCTLISVVTYCLALVCRYGGVLQKESDETL